MTLRSRLDEVARCLDAVIAEVSAEMPAFDAPLLRDVEQRLRVGETAREIRAHLRARRMRSDYFENVVFADAPWDLLLDLYAAKLEQGAVSISSACIAANIPSTTALSYLNRLQRQGMLRRIPDPFDARRGFVELTDKASDAMQAYLSQAAAIGGRR